MIGIYSLTPEDLQVINFKLDDIRTTLTAIAAAATGTRQDLQMLDVPEAAKMLNVSEKTLRGYILTGRLPAFDLNKGTGKRPIYKIEANELHVFIAKIRN